MTYYDTYEAMYYLLTTDDIMYVKKEFDKVNHNFLLNYIEIKRELMTSKDAAYLKFTFDQYAELMKTDEYIKYKEKYL